MPKGFTFVLWFVLEWAATTWFLSLFISVEVAGLIAFGPPLVLSLLPQSWLPQRKSWADGVPPGAGDPDSDNDWADAWGDAGDGGGGDGGD